MNVKYTESMEVMIGLGVNPGMVSGYSKLSLEPVSFTRSDRLGWGDEWTADHSAFANIWPAKEVSVDGLSITVDNRISEFAGKRRHEALMKAWREKWLNRLEDRDEEHENE